MKEVGRLFWLLVGGVLGVAGTLYFVSGPAKVLANSNDRYEDFIMCTGPVEVIPKTPTDGVWVLDYKGGKLLGTVINKANGKIVSWAEVDLVNEFNIQPRQNVHFMMTSGTIAQGQAALYVAETTTGKFGVYTMGPRPDHQPGMVIRRHDLTWFRQPGK
jgi:hypothetical protein